MPHLNELCENYLLDYFIPGIKKIDFDLNLTVGGEIYGVQSILNNDDEIDPSFPHLLMLQSHDIVDYLFALVHSLHFRFPGMMNENAKVTIHLSNGDSIDITASV